jgi:hypothetical protein
VTPLKQDKEPGLEMTTDSLPSVIVRNGHSQCVVCDDLNPRSLYLSFEKMADEAVVANFTA